MAGSGIWQQQWTIGMAAGVDNWMTAVVSGRLCPKPFTGIEEHCLEKSMRVEADYQYVMIN